MATPYSQDLRDRVLAASDRGLKTKQVVEALAVSPAWVRRVKQRRREDGETSARPMGGPRVIKIEMTRLARLVTEHPDATVAELRQRLGVQCSESGVSMALKRLGLTFKKRRSMLQSKTAPMSSRNARYGSVSKVRPTLAG